MYQLKAILWGLLALGLAATHYLAYDLGREQVQHEWDKAKLEAAQDIRRIEQHRQTAIGQARDSAVRRETVIVRDAAYAADVEQRMRDEIARVRERARESLAAATQSADAFADVLQQCVREYRALAEIADRHASDALTLREAWPK